MTFKDEEKAWTQNRLKLVCSPANTELVFCKQEVKN